MEGRHYILDTPGGATQEWEDAQVIYEGRTAELNRAIELIPGIGGLGKNPDGWEDGKIWGSIEKRGCPIDIDSNLSALEESYGKAAEIRGEGDTAISRISLLATTLPLHQGANQLGV